MGLTTSQQDYIKAVYELSGSGEGAHVSDIAHMLGVNKSSASVAMKALQQKKMVRRDSCRMVYLTAEGKWEAAYMIKKYETIKGFLIGVLKIDGAIADKDACAIEHVISIETLCSLCRFTNRKCTRGCYMKTDTTPNRHANS